ncbi:kinase-like domain-containing protein, partial [Baffinella frigidus]
MLTKERSVRFAPTPEGEEASSASTPQSRSGEDHENDCIEQEPATKRQLQEVLKMGTRGGWLVKPGGLEVGRQIGLGHFGAVYQGTHIASEKIVAVKRIREDRTRKEKNRSISDLVSEIALVSKLGAHPYIVGFVGASIDESNSAFSDPIMILEYMDGGCLQDVLEAQSNNGSPWRPPKATSYSWCTQLCAALSFLHRRDTPLVHRDIKAANLFFRADLTTLKLGDFAMCRPVRALQVGTDSQVVRGIFTHMAPEVFDASAIYSETSDIFSAAVCMVHLITGEHAYAGDAELRQPELLARRVALEGYRAPLENR